MATAVRARVWLGIVFAFFLGGVLPIIGCRQRVTRADMESSTHYREILNQWTREARSYQGIEKTKYADPTIRHFYPYVTPWKSAYTVRFPKSRAGAHTAGSIRIDITGVAGRVELVW